MLDAQAPAAYRPATTDPSARCTCPSTVHRSPPRVKPAYMAWPSVRSNAAQGPVSCGSSQSGCLWNSGSSPRAAPALYAARVAARFPGGMPSPCSISVTLSHPSMNGTSGICGYAMCTLSTIRNAALPG